MCNRNFQLSAGYCHFGWLVGWLVVSRVCRVSVRAINRSSSGFPNALVLCCCCFRKPARWENQTAIYRCWQCTQLKAGPRAYAPTSSQLSARYCHFGWLVGLVVSRVCPVSVRAINRSTSLTASETVPLRY